MIYVFMIHASFLFVGITVIYLQHLIEKRREKLRQIRLEREIQANIANARWWADLSNQIKAMRVESVDWKQDGF